MKKEPTYVQFPNGWIGKTIERVVYNELNDGTTFYIRFTDGAYSGVELNRGYEHGDETLEDAGPTKILETLRSLGLITQEEYDAKNQAAVTALENEHKAHRRREYEKLKQEFEAKENQT